MKNRMISCMLCLLFIGLTAPAIGAKIVVKKGDLAFLKEVKSMKVEFDYSNMAVGKYDKEENYLKDKSAKYNKKEAGKGDKWAKAWKADREARFEPKFMSLFNEHVSNGMSISKDAESEYRMVVKTVFTEPGFNVGVTRRPAMCNYVLEIYKGADTSPVAVVNVDKVPGSQFGGYDFDTGVRIAECYALCGKDFAKFLSKKYFK